jgi:3D-(3,5/4)-trihydroxycyclohexane-1,2-dione acylhydrolase (decyclizing)
VPSYESWWDVPVAEIATDESVVTARAEYERAREAQRQYIQPTSPSTEIIGGRP